MIILLLYYQSCKDESWIDIAKYLKEDVPRLVSSQHVDSVDKIISVVFKSLPSNFNQFIRWVAEIRITEDSNQNLSAEEKSRLKLKVFSKYFFHSNPKLHENCSSLDSLCDLLFMSNFNLLQQLVLKEVHETELFKHINKFLSSVGYEDSLTYAAAKACCQGAEILSGSPSKEFCCRETCVKCIKGMSLC